MATIGEVFFMLQFILMIGIVLAKIYNVMTLGKFYQEKYDSEGNEEKTLVFPFMLFFVHVLLFGVGFISVMFEPSALMGMLMLLESWLMIPAMMLFIIEILIYLGFKAKGSMNKIKKDNFYRG